MDRTPHIEVWLNSTVPNTTLYAPKELMFGTKRPNLFQGILPEVPEGEEKLEEVLHKIAKAHERMKQKVNKRERKRRRGSSNWKPRLQESVLLRIQPISDAVLGVTGKFIRPFEGPYFVSRIIPPSAFELTDGKGKIKGEFNLT
jgi:hypothetical protein